MAAKDYTCGKCNAKTARGAKRCSNTSCRTELAFCSYCKDVVPYELDGGNGGGAVRRDMYLCGRCGERVLKCRTWLMGGSCNGLARAGDKWHRQLCDDCKTGATEFAKRVGVLALGSALGSVLRRK